MAEKGNKHYGVTKKLVETTNFNADVINKHQNWTSEIAKTTNRIGEVVDHNAHMLNGINEWNEQISKSVNKLNEWGEEKAKAINKMHEWTSSIAKNLNVSMNYTEDMMGRAMSKSDAKKLVEWIELLEEQKNNPELKKQINEMLEKHGVYNTKLNEATIKGIQVLDTPRSIKVNSDTSNPGLTKGVEMDDKTKTIIGKVKQTSFKKGSMPKGLKTLDKDFSKQSTGKSNIKGIMTLDTTKSVNTPKVTIKGDGPKNVKNQNLKLDTKPAGKLKENFNRTIDIKSRASKLDEKLSNIMSTLEKQKEMEEKLLNRYPFIAFLSENDKTKFAALSVAEKEKVAVEMTKVPTTDPEIISNIWESFVTSKNEQKTEEPLWLKSAPKKYRDIYEKSPKYVKESIQARSEYFTLETQYQINDFWEKSGLVEKPNLNEVFVPKTKTDFDNNYQKMVEEVGQAMLKYNK